MPEVIVAKTAGFCFGVSRAVNMVFDETKKGDRVRTCGPIVHNETVIRELEEKGVSALESEADFDNVSGGTVVIRAHGIPEKIENRLREQGINVVDATCPFVKKIHNIVQGANGRGRQVIIVGDASHPEVQGIFGRAAADTVIIDSFESFKSLNLPKNGKYSLVAQTTFNYEKLLEIIDNLQNLKYDIECFNTVCNATQERQKEAEEIASKVDAMIVIGSRNSSNTRKLYEICSSKCKVTMLIQTMDDLTGEDFHSLNSVGITAGASTPKHIIEEVQTYVRS